MGLGDRRPVAQAGELCLVRLALFASFGARLLQLGLEHLFADERPVALLAHLRQVGHPQAERLPLFLFAREQRVEIGGPLLGALSPRLRLAQHLVGAAQAGFQIAAARELRLELGGPPLGALRPHLGPAQHLVGAAQARLHVADAGEHLADHLVGGGLARARPIEARLGVSQHRLQLGDAAVGAGELVAARAALSARRGRRPPRRGRHRIARRSGERRA